MMTGRGGALLSNGFRPQTTTEPLAGGEKVYLRGDATRYGHWYDDRISLYSNG